jgi:hypothetical protein
MGFINTDVLSQLSKTTAITESLSILTIFCTFFRSTFSDFAKFTRVVLFPNAALTSHNFGGGVICL